MTLKLFTSSPLSRDFAGADVDVRCSCRIDFTHNSSRSIDNCELDGSSSSPYMIRMYPCDVFVTLHKSSHCFEPGQLPWITRKAEDEG
jgi:hypothetical protein